MMGSAYTPGLKVSAATIIDKIRRLPLKGDVLVKIGDKVDPDTVVARTELPGILQSVKLAEKMGIEPEDIKKVLQVKIGDRIEKGTLLAVSKGLFGMFKTEERSSVEGALETISEATGNLGVRQAATPIEKDAYVRGIITRIIPNEGVVVECKGAMVQGIFGVGGERLGAIAVITKSASDPMTESDIKPEHKGKIVVGGSNISLGAMKKAAEIGVLGLVAGGVIDRDRIDYLRLALKDPAFDIGVAITGTEPIPFSLVVTEGFGTIRMAERTFKLFQSLEGKIASINGATQIRAGVIRPEVIVPLENIILDNTSGDSGGELIAGTPIRVIREPYFGILGHVTELPSELVQVDSETWVRVLRAKLEDGRNVTVPRANVEIIVGD